MHFFKSRLDVEPKSAIRNLINGFSSR